MPHHESYDIGVEIIENNVFQGSTALPSQPTLGKYIVLFTLRLLYRYVSEENMPDDPIISARGDLVFWDGWRYRFVYHPYAGNVERNEVSGMQRQK